MKRAVYICIAIVVVAGAAFYVANREEVPAAPAGETSDAPYIESVRPAKAKTGDTIDLVGRNFAGFEGDLDAWITNSKGETAYLPPSGSLYQNDAYKNVVPGKEVIRVKLEARLCAKNTSYSGEPCDAYVDIVPGIYEIFTRPWGKESNKVRLEVTK